MNEAHYYNSIALVTHSGYATMKRYRAAAGGSWEAAYHMLRGNPALIPEDAPPLPDAREAYEYMESFGIRLVLNTEREFPEALRHIPYPPFGIYLRGGNGAKAAGAFPSMSATLAVVGTRRASADGKKIARSFARELAGAGFTIASGLAFGIDGAAHEGALDAGGATVAVLAGGLDAVYPHSHRGLAERILASGGTLVSEYPPGEAPLAYRFIERNRIMSGISRGALIVEAPESSGALATARYAVEQDREVFVVPGAVTASGFKGSHALIRQGAELVTSPDDILSAYDIDKKKSVLAAQETSSPEEILVLKALADISAPADVDKLIALTRLEPRIVNRVLSFLLLRGIVKETDAGYTI
ncbi:MAG TPA: DNA-processing protein DprA [Candidatus Paceibacterota bacterium]